MSSAAASAAALRELLLLSLMGSSGSGASKSKAGPGKADATTCRHCIHPPNRIASEAPTSPTIHAKDFGLPLSESDVWACCLCSTSMPAPPAVWSAVDTAIFVTVNGGFRLVQSSVGLAASISESRRQAPAVLRSLADKFLKPIADRAWPLPWQQNGFPRLKWRDGPFVKLFGGPPLGAFVLLRAAGFVLAADDAYLELPDAASDERVAHVRACIERVRDVADQIEQMYTVGNATALDTVGPLLTFYEVWLQVQKFYSDMTGRVSARAVVKPLNDAEYDRTLRIKGAVGALQFFLHVLMGELPLVLDPSAEQKTDALKYSRALVELELEVELLVANRVVAEWRAKQPALPPAAADSVVSVPSAPVLGATKRARTGDIGHSEEELLSIAIAESLQSGGGGGAGGAAAAELAESDELNFQNDGKPKGLINTRQSCHANSLLQALFALKPLRRDLLLAHRAIAGTGKASDNKTLLAATECLHELAHLFARMDLSSARAVSARRFMEVLMRSTDLRLGVQHDVTEVKNVMLDKLEAVIPSLKTTFYGTLLRLAAPSAAAAAATAAAAAADATVWPPANDDDLTESAAAAAAASDAGDEAPLVDVEAAVREKTTFSDVIVHLRRDSCADDLDEALARTFLGEQHVRLSSAILVPPPLLTLAVQRVTYDLHSRRAEKIDTMMRFRRSLSLHRYTSPTDGEAEHVVAINKRLARVRERLAQLERASAAVGAPGGTSVNGALATLTAFLSAQQSQLGAVLPSGVPHAAFAEHVALVQQHVAQQTLEFAARAERLRVLVDALTSERDGDDAYSLHAVLVHQGAPESGHYFAFVRANWADADAWYKCNDALVDSVTWTDVCESSFGGARGKGSAYCLIYASPEYRALSLSIEAEQLLDWYDSSVVQSVAAGTRSALNDSSVF